MRILILTCATGGGHLRAAAALEKYIRESSPHDVIQMDFLKSIGKLLDKTIVDSYLFMAKRTPSLFGRLYKSTNKDTIFADVVPRATELTALQLLPHLIEAAPDVIISVHPFATEMVSSLKESGKLYTPLICIMTDYGVHKAWIAPAVDAYVVASDDMVSDVEACGVPRKNIHPYGIPVHDVFFDKEDQATLLAEMGLDTDVPTILFMAGSMGVSNIAELYRALSASPLDLQLIIITGNNKKLYELMEEESKVSPKKTKLLRFTQEVERYMHASDLIVTKPGGLTVSEALACNLPLAVFDAIPGQEEDNANFLQTHDMGVRITKDNFSAVISSLIEHKDRLRRMRESCRQFDKSRANERIVALAEDLVGNFVSFDPDVEIMTQKGAFFLRVAVALFAQGCVLTERTEDGRCILPEGVVKINEAAEDAARRLLKDRFHLNQRPDHALFISQRFYRGRHDIRVHRMTFYFEADGTALKNRGLGQGDSRFEWVPLDALESRGLEPRFLQKELLDPPKETRFLCVNTFDNME